MLKLLKIEFNRNRIYGLDILRAFAILFVVIGHGKIYLPNKYHHISALLSFDGVTIFFVLSGYLIGDILIKILESKKATFKTLFDFWIRRWFRTLPNYYFILFLLMIILPFIFTGNIKNPIEKLDYFLFIQNINKPHPSFFPVAWSLTVEEWFYLFIPSLIFIFVGLFNIKPNKSILLVAVSVLVLTIFIRYYKYSNLPFNTCNDCDWDNIWDLNFRKQVITRLDSLMFGLLGAFFSFYYKNKWLKHKVTFLIIGLLILTTQKYTSIFTQTGGLIYIYTYSLLT